MRGETMKYKRIVFKVGTSSLTNPDGSLSRAKVKAITQQLATLHDEGHELILVSSGAIAAGFSSLGFKKRPTKIADKQASAAVGQGLLLEEYTSNLLMKGIVSAQILLTQDDFVDKRRYNNAHQALSVLLTRHAIPIINENDTVSIEELKVGDNDTLSAQVAAMVQADLLVLLTDVDGVYNDNPSKNPSAKRFDKIDEITKELVEMAGVPVYICSSLKEQALIEAVHQTVDGTYFTAQEKVMKTHKQWLALYAKSKGKLVVDTGAKQALQEEGKSLLISGVKAVEGEFYESEIVTVVDEHYQVIGKGQTRLSKYAIAQQLSKNNRKGIVIHRDDWMTISGELELLEQEF